MRARTLGCAAIYVILAVGMAGEVSGNHEKAVRHYLTGVSLLGQGRQREAIGELKRAVHQDYEFADAHAKLADAYFQLETIEGRRLAVEEYRLAIRYAQDNPDYHLALGKVYIAQTFPRYAEKAFLKTIEIDPERVDAYLELGLIHLDRWRQYWVDLEKAYDALFEGYRRGSTDHHLLYALAQVANELARYDFAETLCVQILEENPDDLHARFQHAMSLHGQERLEEAETEYVRAISRSTLEDKLVFLGIDEVASHPLRQELRRIDPKAVTELTRRYWRSNDPYLATRVNERLLEHWRRVLQADFYFSVPRLGVLGRHSARGQSHVRYGPPQSRDSYIDEDDRPVELWTYHIEDQTFQLLFRDTFLNGEYGFPFDPRGGPAEQWEALLRQLPQHYVPTHEGKQIRMMADACSFYRGEAQTHQDICYAIPGRELEFRRDEAGWHGELVRQIVIYDQDWNVVAEDSTAVATEPVGSLELLKQRSLVDLRRFRLLPGRYLAAISVEDTLANVMGLAEAAFTARSFDWEGLRLSDIQLARSIGRATTESPFNKGGLRVEPEPSRRFQRSRPVHLYWEIYGLELDENGHSQFGVTLRVIPLQVEEAQGFWDGVRKLFGGRPSTPPHIASTFTYERSQSSLPQHLSLDLTSLRPGHYRLTVGVEDRVAGVSASRTTTLWIAR